MKKLVITLLTFACFLSAQAQTDNEFWFVVPKITKDHNPGDAKRSYFVFTNSNDTDAYVTIYMPKEPAWLDTTIRVLKHSSYRWQVNYRLSTLSNTYILTDPNPYGMAGKNIKGIHIVSMLNVLVPYSRVDITVYYEYGNVNNPDIFTLKGRNALGTEFFTSFQTDCYNVGQNWSEPAYSAFDIVFTENNTFIDLVIPPGKAIVNGFTGAGVPYAPLTGTVLNIGPFNAGETFSCIPTKTTAPEKTGWYASDKYFGRAAADHLAGVQIKTRNGKKIAVTLKDDSMKSLWDGGYDLNGDQTVPVSITGNDYIAMRGQLNTAFPDNGWYNRPPAAHQWYNPPPDIDKVVDQERLYIMATRNSTRIQIDGTTVDTLNAGEQYIYPIPSTKSYTYVKSLDSSIYVYQITGFGSEVGGAVLPSLSTCTGSTNVGFARTVGGNGNGFFQNIMVRNSAKAGFRLNGKITPYLDASKFFDVAGTDWSVARLGFTNNPPDTVGNYLFPVGTILNISNTMDVFHLGIINGGASSGTRYGYFSNYDAVKPSAYISESGTGDIRICYGQRVQIFAKGGVSYSWNPVDSLSDPNSDHPIAAPSNTTNYIATVSGYCGTIDSTNINISVAPPLKAVYSLDDTFGCAPLNIQFHDQSLGAAQIRYWYNYLNVSEPPDFKWSFYTPGPPPRTYNKPNNDSTFYHTYTNTANPDTYKVFHTMVAIRNTVGCVDTLKRDLIAYPTVITDITNEAETIYDSTMIVLNHTTTNAHYYLWDFGDFTSSNGEYPSHTYRNLTGTSVIYKTRLTATSKFNCSASDSVNFTIRPHNFGTVENISICEGDSFKGHTASGVFADTLLDSGGLDSIVITYLTVNPVYNIIENISICEGQSYKGQTVSATFTDSLTSVSVCDSVVTTNLIVNPVYNITEYKAICEGQSYKGHTVVGTFTDSLKSISDCDSIIITNLTVNPLPAVEAGTDQSICQGDTLILLAEGIGEISWLTLSGNPVNVWPSITITYTAQAVDSCGTITDSVIVTVKPKPQTPAVTQNGIQLESSSLTGNQWYSEADGMLTGAETNIYEPSKNGVYYVIVTSDGCNSDKSNSFVFTITGISKLDLDNKVDIYPIPVINIMEIESSTSIESLQIMGILGNLVFKKENINLTKFSLDMSDFKSGYYTLLVKLDGYPVMITKKVLKQ